MVPIVISEMSSGLRPPSFGGLLGGGMMGLVYIILTLGLGLAIPADLSIYAFITVGGAVGAGFHKLVSAAYEKITSGSIGRFVTFFERLGKLLMLRSLLSEGAFQSTAEGLARMMVLDVRVENQLPPAENVPNYQLEAHSKKLVALGYEASATDMKLAEQEEKIKRLELEQYKAKDEVDAMRKEISQTLTEALSSQRQRKER